MRFGRLGLLLSLGARLAVAQTPVMGTVHDSVGRRPLAGAAVQIVDATSAAKFSRTVMADSIGRFVVADVPNGRYWLGFLHPMLDSLGIEPPLHEVVVASLPVRADLAIPAPARLRAAICGAQLKMGTQMDSGVAVVGIVRDPSGAAIAGAAVSVEWLEWSFTPNGIVRRAPHFTATTAENGWFALCDVPSLGLVSFLAIKGADSTDRLEVQLPSDAFQRRDLYLASSRDAASQRLTGTVATLGGSRRIANAQISVGGAHTRSDEKGEWALVAPGGTRMLDVRALGFYPERRAVDVVSGAAPVGVSLTTLKSVLDTVRITGRRVIDYHKNAFEERRRVAAGTFITAADIARRKPKVASELLRTVPALKLERTNSPDGMTSILVRGNFDPCGAAVYLDGRYMGELTAEEVDDLVHPDQIAGIEIYGRVYIPPEFNRSIMDTSCGSVVIWRK